MPANWKDFFIIHSDPLRPVADVDQQATYWAMQRTKLGNVKAECYARIGLEYTYRVTYDPNELCIPYPQLTIQQQRDRDEAAAPAIPQSAGLDAGTEAPNGATFFVGDQVEKYTGDYQITGEIRAVLLTKRGQTRYVVEHEPGILHIYSRSNLRALGGTANG